MTPKQLTDDDILIQILHSEDSRERLTMFVSYLDESADENSYGVAGYLLRGESYSSFQETWKETVLERHGIECLHMKEFVPPWGELCHIQGDKKIALLKDAIKVIRRHALCGFAMCASRSEYDNLVTNSPSAFKVTLEQGNVEQVISPFAVLLGACVHLATRWTMGNEFNGEQIAAMMDKGGRYGVHAQKIFDSMKYFEWETPYNLRNLTPADDCDETPLQAADILAYEARKEFSRKMGKRQHCYSKLLRGVLGSRIPHWGGSLSSLNLTFIGGGIHPVDRFQRIKPIWYVAS